MKHDHVFLVPCKKRLVQCPLYTLYSSVHWTSHFHNVQEIHGHVYMDGLYTSPGSKQGLARSTELLIMITKLMVLANNTYLTTLVWHPETVQNPYHCEHCVQVL